MSKRLLFLCGLGLLTAASGPADPADVRAADGASSAASSLSSDGAALQSAPQSPPVASAAPRARADETFKDKDYETLGKLIAKYREARGASKGLDKAQEELKETLDAIQKRIKRDPLSMPSDMGRALWSSYQYEKNQKVKKGKVDFIEAPSYFDEKAKLGYAIWVPVKYEVKKGPYPLILCIPGEGEDPKTHITEKWVDAAIRDNALIACVTMPADTKLWLENCVQGEEGGACNMLFTLGQLIRSYAVDFDRVYLAGRERGVEAAVTYASRYPDRFAGVIGRTGDAPADLAVENMSNLPMYFAGAGGNATALEEKLKTLGYSTLQRKDDATEADIWAWIQDHPRASNPAEVVVYPTATMKIAYWLETLPTDAQGTVYVKGKLDRTANTIIVEGEGVTKFQVYFNDTMLDLDKPIKVIANGAEVSRAVPRSLPRALDFITNARSDPGRFYVNNMQFDLPPKPKPKDTPGKDKKDEKPGDKAGEKSGEKPPEKGGEKPGDPK